LAVAGTATVRGGYGLESPPDAALTPRQDQRGAVSYQVRETAADSLGPVRTRVGDTGSSNQAFEPRSWTTSTAPRSKCFRGRDRPASTIAAGGRPATATCGGRRRPGAQFVRAGLIDELVLSYAECTLGIGGRLLKTYPSGHWSNPASTRTSCARGGASLSAVSSRPDRGYRGR
jgi:hypothetical protein